MASVRKSLVYSVSSQYLNRGINLVSIMFIVRMLTPEQLGVFAIASSIVLIASELKSFGADGYLIREKSIDKALVSKAIGVSSSISWSIGTLVFCSSWYLESFYEQADLAILIQLLALSFFLSPHIGAGKALLARDFKFERILIVDTSSQIVQFVSVVVLIYQDFGYFSLVLSSLFGYVIELLFVILFRTKDYAFIPTYGGSKAIMSFGLYVTLANLFRKMSMSLPDLIIGKMGTVSDVAYFSRGAGFVSFLAMTVNSGVTPVIAPYLAEQQRKGVSLVEPYLQSTKMIGGLMIPVLAVAAYTSETVILVMFSDQWTASVPLVTILCVAAIFRSISGMSIPTLITAGHEKVMCYMDLFLFIMTAILVINLYPYGLEAAAYCFLIVALIRFFMTLVLMKKYFNLSVRRQLSNNITNVAIALMCVGFIEAYDQIVGFGALYEKFALVVLLSVISWCLGLFVFKHPLSVEVAHLAKNVLHKLTK